MCYELDCFMLDIRYKIAHDEKKTAQNYLFIHSIVKKSKVKT